MRIIIHLESGSAEFITDKKGDLHIYGKGLKVDLTPIKEKRGRKPKVTATMTATVGMLMSPAHPVAPIPAEEKQKIEGIVMDDKGWE